MSKTNLLAIAMALGFTWIPAKANEAIELEENVQLSIYDEAYLPQQIHEEFRSLATNVTDAEDAMAEADGNLDSIVPRHRRHGRRWHGRRGRDRSRIVIRFPFPRFNRVCYARDRRGRLYRAAGFSTYENLRWRALRNCRLNSSRPRSCHSAGCR